MKTCPSCKHPLVRWDKPQCAFCGAFGGFTLTKDQQRMADAAYEIFRGERKADAAD